MPDRVTSTAWIFKQLEPPFKQLTLSGASAPHGRPRQKPVVSDGIELRMQKVMYPGTDVPTRHIFGSRYDDWDLTGRWRDAFMGPNGSRKLVQDFQDFVRDGVRTQITWGNIISYTGIIKHFVPKWESPYDIPWEMKIEVDVPDAISIVTSQPRQSPGDLSQKISAALQDGETLDHIISRDAPGIQPDFLDGLANFVGSIQDITKNLVNLSNQIESFEKAILADIQVLRSTVSQLRTAVLILRNAAFSARDEALFIYRSSASDISWGVKIATLDNSTYRALALMAEFDRQCDLAERGKVKTSITATLHDSWESMSTSAYGGPNRAGDIRSANGIKSGEKPKVGFTYLLPH